MELQNKQTQMRKGLVVYVVLLSISKKETYVIDILRKLQLANVIMVEGTLYPLLNRLQREALISHTWKESNSGPPRKYYNLTSLGTDTLKSLHETWQELIKSIKTLQK